MISTYKFTKFTKFTKMQLLKLFSLVFFLYAISFCVVPKHLEYSQIPIGNSAGIIIGWSNNVRIGDKMFNKDSFMNKTCHMWNTNGISRIQFYFFMEDLCQRYETNGQINNIYMFLIMEITIFMILSIILCRGIFASDTKSAVKIFLILFLLTWIASIGFDISGTSSYHKLNGFVYQQTYKVSGNILIRKYVLNTSDTDFSFEFNDQETLIKGACDMKEYYYHNNDKWFMTFNTCQPEPIIFSVNKLCSFVLKIGSFMFLIYANIVHRYLSNDDQTI